MDPQKFNAAFQTLLESVPTNQREEFGRRMEPLLRRAAKAGLADGETYRMFGHFKATYDENMAQRVRAAESAGSNVRNPNAPQIRVGTPAGVMERMAAWNAGKVAGVGNYDPLGKLAASVLNVPIAAATNWIGQNPNAARQTIQAVDTDDPLSLLTGAGALAPTLKSGATLRAGAVGARALGALLGSKLGPGGALLGGLAGGALPMIPYVGDIINKPIDWVVNHTEDFLYGKEGGEASRQMRQQRMASNPLLGFLNESTLPMLATGKIDPAHLREEAATARTLLSRGGKDLLRAAKAGGSRAATPEAQAAMQRLASLGNTAAMTAMGIHGAPEGTGIAGKVLGGLQGLVSTPYRQLGPVDTMLGIGGPHPPSAPKPRVASMRPEPVPAETPAQRPVRGLLPPGPSDGRTTVQGDGFVMNPVESNPFGFHSTDAITPPVRVPLPGSNGSMRGEFPPMYHGELPYRALQEGILPVPGGLSPRPGAAPLEHTVASMTERNQRALGFDPSTSSTPPAEGPSPILSRPGSLQARQAEVSNVRPGMTEADATRFATPPRPFKMPESMPVPEALPEPPASGRNKLERGTRPYKPGPRRITNRATTAAETPPADLPVPEVAPAKPAPAPKPAAASKPQPAPVSEPPAVIEAVRREYARGRRLDQIAETLAQKGQTGYDAADVKNILRSLGAPDRKAPEYKAWAEQHTAVEAGNTAPTPKPEKTSNVRGGKPTVADFMSRDPQPPPTDAQIEAQLTERGKFNKATDERLNGGEASNVRSEAKEAPTRKPTETYESLDAQHKQASETLTKARAALAKAKEILTDPNAKLDAETRTHLEGQVRSMGEQVKELERTKKNLASRKSKLKPAEEKEVDARPKPGRLDDTSASIIEERNQQERAKAEAQQPVVNRVDPKTVEYSPAPTLSLRVDTKLENTEWRVHTVERAKPDENGMMLARGMDGGQVKKIPYRDGAVNIVIRRPGTRDQFVFGAGVDKAGNIVTHDGVVISTEKSHTPESIAKKNEDVAKGKEGDCL